MLDTCTGRRSGRGPTVWPAQRSTIASMCFGVVPQQPPTIVTP